MNKIQIQNEITIFTLKKIYKTQAYYQTALDNNSEDKQFLENLDNQFITEDALKLIIIDIFRVKTGGGFRDSLDVFGTRNKKRFVKKCLCDLVPDAKWVQDHIPVLK